MQEEEKWDILIFIGTFLCVFLGKFPLKKSSFHYFHFEEMRNIMTLFKKTNNQQFRQNKNENKCKKE